MKVLWIIFLQVSTLMAQPFEIQGHRGARGLAPENSLPAFKKALDLGIEVLELDVIISKDGKVLVSHEASFNPLFTTDPQGKPVTKAETYNLYQMNYSDIKAFDVGSRKNPLFPQQKPEKCYKPQLSEVLDFCNKYCKEKKQKAPRFNIELKSLEEDYGKSQPKPEVFIDKVLKVLKQHAHASQICLQSFDFNVLNLLGQQRKSKYKYLISVLIEPDDNNDLSFNLGRLSFLPDIWSPNYKVLNGLLVQEIHQKGIKVIPWTVNTKEDMLKIRAFGCDGLISDYPDRALELFKP
jgi:glycerophosphoryl diester phosphodiesterase